MNRQNQLRLVSILITCFILFGIVSSVSAQSQIVNINIQRIITSEFPEVSAFVSIFDSNGLPIANINKEDISLSEDGAAINNFSITELNNIDTPLAIALLIDSSGSMRDTQPPAIDNAKAAAVEFIQKLQTQDSVGVISYNDVVVVEQPLTTEKSLAASAVNQISAIGGTSMYDAIAEGVDMLKESGKRNVIIILTDGQDSASELDLSGALNAAKEWHIPVYPIGFGIINEFDFDTIANETGSFPQIKPDSTTLDESLNKILQLLRHQYQITYTSLSQADDSTHQLFIYFEYSNQPYSAEMDFIPKPLSFSLLSPQSGDIISITTDITVEPTSVAKISNVTFLINYKEFATLNYPTEGENTYSVNWDLEDVSPGVYEIEVVVEDVLGNRNSEMVEVTVREPILIEIISPEDGASFKTSPTIKVEIDSVQDIETATISIDGEEWRTFNSSSFEELWQIQAVPDGTYVIEVSAEDVDGRRAAEEISVYKGVRLSSTESEAGESETVVEPAGEPNGGMSNNLQLLIIGGGGLLLVLLAVIIPIILRKKRKAQPVAASSSSLVLKEVKGISSGTEWQLSDHEIQLGRKRDDNDIALQGLNASRRMAVIRKVDHHFIIYPLNPKNPILINDQEITQQALLEPGDQIKMGESIFIVEKKI